jgi:hypothetical protein
VATLAKRRAYASGAMLSGVMWSLLWYCSGPEAWNAPLRGRVTLACFVLSGAVTGLTVGYLFLWVFQRALLPLSLVLPFATLPAAATVFALLLWLLRLAFGSRTGIFPGEPQAVLQNAALFVLVGFWPVFYLLALVTQWVLQVLLKVEASSDRTPALFMTLLIGLTLLWIAVLAR